jgi:serine/threonine protein kinase
MEYIEGGTLKQLMEDKFHKNQKFTEEQISIVIQNLLEGIRYLHQFNIIHRDIKPGMYFSYNDRKYIVVKMRGLLHNQNCRFWIKR